MAIEKRKTREIVLQLLYAKEVASESLEDYISMVMSLLEVSKKNVYLGIGFAEQVLAHKEEIDRLISEASTSYSLERLSLIDKNILRMAIFELIVEKVDIGVVIDESIRLSKKFSTPEASGFVHAIIDTIGKKDEIRNSCSA